MTRPLIITLFMTLFLIVLNFTITAIASPYIVGDLGGDRYIAVYGLSFYGFGAAITIPLAKPLGARFKAKQLFLYCMASFALTTLFSGLAPTYFIFVACRLFMGMASGPFYALLSHSFSCLVPEDKKIVAAWMFMTILVVVPVIGASYGGTVAYLYHWRAAFLGSAFIATLLIFPLSAYLKKVKIPPLAAGFDWIGWGFYAVGIFCIAFALTAAQQLDWYRSPILLAAILLGIPCIGYFLLRSFNHETPAIDLRLFASPVFALAMLCLSLLFGVYFGSIVLLSIWLTLDAQFTPIWIGMLIGSMGIAGLFPRFIIEKRLGKIHPLIFIAIATLLLGFSCFYTTQFDSDINFSRIAFSRILAGFGLALFLPSIFTMISESTGPDAWIDAFDIFQVLRSLSSALGVAFFTIAWQRRSVFYHERLGENLNAKSVAAQTFFNQVETLHVPGDPLAQLNDYLDRRSSSLALDDIFYLMGWILAGLFVLICFILIAKRLFTKHESKTDHQQNPRKAQ